MKCNQLFVLKIRFQFENSNLKNKKTKAKKKKKMNHKWTIEGEFTFLQSQAAYRKKPGTLYLTNKRIGFFLPSQIKPMPSIPFSKINGIK